MKTNNEGECMRTLACPLARAALDALVRQLEDHGANASRHPQTIMVRSTTGKPMLSAITADNRQWSVQVTVGVAQAFDLKLWPTL
jgi:hypothetical protein